MKHLLLLTAAAVALLPGTVQAQGITNLTVNGDVVTAQISLPGGIGADLEIDFEDSVGLTASSIGVSAALINPLDSNLLSRIKGGVSTSIPTGFPVMLTVEPPSSGGLSFSGTYTLELHTTNLSYDGDLRMFSGPVGGKLEEVTATMGAGSYRARTRKGTFSDFLIVLDARSPATMVDKKVKRLDKLLDDYGSQITSSVYDTLSDQLDDVKTHVDASQFSDAITDLESFISTVETNAGADIPDVWRSARDLDNVAGELVGAAETLRFSLRLAS